MDSNHREQEHKLEWVLRCAETDLRLAIREGLRDVDPASLPERLHSIRDAGEAGADVAPHEEEAVHLLSALMAERAVQPGEALETLETLAERCLSPAWLRVAGVCLQSVTVRPGMSVTAAHRAMTADLHVEDRGGGGPFVVWDCFATVTRAANLGFTSVDGQLRIRHVTDSEIGLLRSVPVAATTEEVAALDAREALRSRIDAALALLSGGESKDLGAEGPGKHEFRGMHVNLLGASVDPAWEEDSDVSGPLPGRRRMWIGLGVVSAALLVVVTVLAVGAYLRSGQTDASAGAARGVAVASGASDAGATSREGADARAVAPEPVVVAEAVTNVVGSESTAGPDTLQMGAEGEKAVDVVEAVEPPTPEHVAEPAPEPVAEPTVERVGKEGVPAAEPAVEPAVEPTAEPLVKEAAPTEPEPGNEPAPPTFEAGRTRPAPPADFRPNLQLTRLAKLYSGEAGGGVKLRELEGGKAMMGECVLRSVPAEESPVRVYQGYKPAQLLCTDRVEPLCRAIGCRPDKAICDVGVAWLRGCGK